MGIIPLLPFNLASDLIGHDDRHLRDGRVFGAEIVMR